MRLITSMLLAVLLVFSAQAQPLLKHETSFVAFAADANSNPPMVFGGKILAEMDRTAAIAVRRLLFASPTGAKDAVTVAIEQIQFKKVAKVKDLLYVVASVASVGEKSIRVSVSVERETKDGREVVADGLFVFVAYDLENGKAVAHGIAMPKQGN